MKVVAVINAKGGVGKTTVATHVAVSAEGAGLTTAVFDLDPQPNSTLWADSRGAAARPAVVPAQPARLAIYLQQAREQQADLVLIDTPPRVEGAAPVAAEHADAILIPVPPKPLDIVALPQTIQLARAAQKPFFVLLNNAPVQGREVAEATTALTQAGIEVVPVVLHTRKAFYSYMQMGQTALDCDPNGRAAAEARALMLWLVKRVGLYVSIQADNQTAAEAA
jgi:chromosome partitioning protein